LARGAILFGGIADWLLIRAVREIAPRSSLGLDAAVKAFSGGENLVQ
jgi:hypothetical protein